MSVSKNIGTPLQVVEPQVTNPMTPTGPIASYSATDHSNGDITKKETTSLDH